MNNVATQNPALVKELHARNLVPKFFEFFELEHRNNNVHNVKLILKVCGGGGGGEGGRGACAARRLWTACGQRCVDSKNSQATPATTSTSSRRQLSGAADAQTAHHTTFSTVPTHQRLGSANAETTPAGAPAGAADRKQRPDATCEGTNG